MNRLIHTAAVVLFLAWPTYATEPPTKFKVWCSNTLKAWVLPYIVKDPSHKTIDLWDRSDPSNPIKVTFTVGKRLAFGWKGGAYMVTNVETDHPAFQKYKGLPLIIKTSHQGRWFGTGRDKFQKILEEELRVYQELLAGLPAVEGDAEWYPKNPNWKLGTLPIAPIIASLDSPTYGQVLVKVFLPGKSVKELAADYKAGKITAEDVETMSKSLFDWYDVSQAASNHVKITPLGATAPRPLTSLDINPENMVYVSDPTYLKLLGIDSETPTFAAYELGEPALTTYRHEELSKEQYRQMWINFVKGSQ